MARIANRGDPTTGIGDLRAFRYVDCPRLVALGGLTSCPVRTANNALHAGVPLRDALILARHADPRTTEHYDRARGDFDRHGVHFLTAYVAGV